MGGRKQKQPRKSQESSLQSSSSSSAAADASNHQEEHREVVVEQHHEILVTNKTIVNGMETHQQRQHEGATHEQATHEGATHEEVNSSSSRFESTYRSSAFMSPMESSAALGQLCCVGEFVEPCNGDVDGDNDEERSEENMFFLDDSIQEVKQARREKLLLIRAHLMHCREKTIQAHREWREQRKQQIIRNFDAQFPAWWLELRDQMDDGRWDGESPLPWLTGHHLDELKAVFERMTGIDCENDQSDDDDNDEEGDDTAEAKDNDENESRGSYQRNPKRRKSEVDHHNHNHCQSDESTHTNVEDGLHCTLVANNVGDHHEHEQKATDGNTTLQHQDHHPNGESIVESKQHPNEYEDGNEQENGDRYDDGEQNDDNDDDYDEDNDGDDTWRGRPPSPLVPGRNSLIGTATMMNEKIM